MKNGLIILLIGPGHIALNLERFTHFNLQIGQYNIWPIYALFVVMETNTDVFESYALFIVLSPLFSVGAVCHNTLAPAIKHIRRCVEERRTLLPC